MGNPNIQQINEKTWSIDEGMVRYFLLEGDDKALLIDTGAGSPNAKEIAESLTSKPLMLINTHTDVDHISGNNAFEWFYVSKEDYEYKQNITTARPEYVEDGDVIDLGNRPIKIYATPGHTEGSISLLDVNNRVIYTGDSVSTATIFMFGAHRSLNKYFASLSKLESLADEYDTIYPCHGTPQLDKAAVGLVKKDLIASLRGDIQCEAKDMFGTKVNVYKGEFTGFFMPEKLEGCPVCGKYVFSEKYEICPVCNWENDPVQRSDFSFAGGANKDSVLEARKKFSND